MTRQINANITFTASKKTIEKYDSEVRKRAERKMKENKEKEVKSSNS